MSSLTDLLLHHVFFGHYWTSFSLTFYFWYIIKHLSPSSELEEKWTNSGQWRVLLLLVSSEEYQAVIKGKSHLEANDQGPVSTPLGVDCKQIFFHTHWCFCCAIWNSPVLSVLPSQSCSYYMSVFLLPSNFFQAWIKISLYCNGLLFYIVFLPQTCLKFPMLHRMI